MTNDISLLKFAFLNYEWDLASFFSLIGHLHFFFYSCMLLPFAHFSNWLLPFCWCRAFGMVKKKIRRRTLSFQRFASSLQTVLTVFVFFSLLCRKFKHIWVIKSLFNYNFRGSTHFNFIFKLSPQWLDYHKCWVPLS